MLLRGVDSSWQSFLGPFNYCAGSTKKEGSPYSLTLSVHPTMSAFGGKADLIKQTHYPFLPGPGGGNKSQGRKPP